MNDVDLFFVNRAAKFQTQRNLSQKPSGAFSLAVAPAGFEMKIFISAALDNLPDNGRNSAYVSARIEARRGYQYLHAFKKFYIIFQITKLKHLRFNL
jgi:hypothetical protein